MMDYLRHVLNQVRQWTTNRKIRKMKSKRESNERKRFESYRAALKLTSPWFPIMAVVITALTYLFPEEPLTKATVLVAGHIGLSINEGVLASFVGLVLALTFWAVISFPARRRATAEESSPPNYHQITQELDSLKYKINSVCPDEHNPRTTVDNGVDELSQRAAYAEVKGQIEQIEKRLKDGGTAWVTGAGYIDLWHRIHR